MTRWMIVGITGSGPLEDPVAVGPYTSERAAERDKARLERAVAYSEGEGAPIFEIVEVTPVRRVGLLAIKLGDDWGEPS